MKQKTYASIIRRGGAYLLDVAIIFVWFFVTQRFIFTPLREQFGSAWMRSGFLLEAYVLLTISLPAWLYFAFLESSPWRASIGKRFVGLVVTDLRGDRIGFWRVLLRTVIKLLPWEIAHMIVNLPTSMWIDPQTGALSFDAPVAGFRYLLFIIVYVLLGVYLITAWRNPRNRSVHDLLAGTVVRYRQAIDS
jgi:uncharacterized RDD family membrane protein YckC